VQESTRKSRLMALGVLLFVSFLSVLRVAAPLWVGMAFGTFMAFTAQPTYRWLAAKLGNRKPLAAVITTVIMGITWTVFGAITIYVLTRELFTLIGVLQAKFSHGSLTDFIGQRGVTLVEKLGINRATLTEKIQSELAAVSNSIATAAGVILSTTSNAVLGIIVGLMTMYYVLVEWPRLPVRLERVLPLDPRHTRALVIEFRDVGRSALIGTIATALVQGLFGGVGYWISGIPHPVTWGLLTALASLIPAVGTALIWVPIGLYLLFTGHTGAGVLELTWGTLVVVGVCDYVIRPRLVGSKGKGHPLLMLVGLLGGIEVFGLTGLIVGPVLMSLFVAILRIYEREVTWESTHPKKS
jgi:predicted PurR-regulated permease PerM